VKTSSRSVKQPYIGGSFASGDDDNFILNSPGFSLFPDSIGQRSRMFFETGSDAIASQIQNLNELWLPENFCRATAKRILLKCKSIKIHYYANPDQAFAGGAKRGILLLHYNKYDPLISQIAARNINLPGVFIIEDFVQAPFDVSKLQGHSAITSLRKICTAELAVAYMGHEAKEGEVNSDYLKLKLAAMSLREEFLQTGNSLMEKKHQEKMQQAAQAENNPSIYLSSESEKSHGAKIDFVQIKQRRQANRKFLENILCNIPEIEILPSDYFFLMVRLKNRDAVRKALFAHGIFPPIHWVDSGHADGLLSLPIDQRYDKNDMERLANVLLQAIQVR